MTDVRALDAPAGPAAGMRELTAAESTHLDRLRGHLASSGAAVGTVDGLGGLLEAAHTAWLRTPPDERPDPGPMISSIAVGVGDLVLAGAPEARWVLHVDAPAASPALLSTDGTAAVVPFTDVRRRWTRGSGQVAPALSGADSFPHALADESSDVLVDATWLAGYVDAAAQHLAGVQGAAGDDPQPSDPTPADERTAEPGVPTPRPPTVDEVPHGRRASHAGEAPAPEPVVRYRTPTELPYVPSVDVQNLALRALDRGLTTALFDGPTPFAMRDDGTTVQVKWFPTDPDEALGLAEHWVVDAIALRAAIGWVVPLDDDAGVAVPGLGAIPSDQTAASQGADHAVVVLASDVRVPGLVVAHRYASHGRDGDAGHPVGEPLVVGPCPTLL